MAKKKRPNWYRMYFGECPFCGRDKSCRERVYGRRPKDKKKRVVYLPDTQAYDYCLAY